MSTSNLNVIFPYSFLGERFVIFGPPSTYGSSTHGLGFARRWITLGGESLEAQALLLPVGRVGLCLDQLSRHAMPVRTSLRVKYSQIQHRCRDIRP